MSEKITNELAQKFIKQFNNEFPEYKNQRLKIHKKIFQNWTDLGTDIDIFLTQKNKKTEIYFIQDNKPFQASNTDMKEDISKDLKDFQKQFDEGLAKEMDNKLGRRNTRRITIGKQVINQLNDFYNDTSYKSRFVSLIPGVIYEDDSQYAKDYQDQVTVLLCAESSETGNDGEESNEEYYDRGQLCPPGVC